jgi:hypothetical protein
MNLKQLIIDLFKHEEIVSFIKSIKEVDIDIITGEVLEHHDPMDLDSFIFEALNRYKDIVLSEKRYRLLNDLLSSVTDWDSYIHIYDNGLKSTIEFSVESFVEDYELEGKIIKLAYQLKTEIENFQN